MNAKITGLYFAPAAGAQMQAATSLLAIAGCGLEGDRYARQAGTYSTFLGARDATLFANEALWDFEQYSGITLHPAQVRRNIFTEGADLTNLIGMEFSIGPVRFRGLRLCPPCLYLARLLKLPEVLPGLARSGGIYAVILNDGIIQVGDALVLVAGPKDTLPR